jgi:hypothetical protein
MSHGGNPRSWGVTLLPLTLVAGLPFVAFTILCLRHFYSLGGFWGDSGVVAHVMWHNDILLHTPLVNGGGSFLATHLTFIFLPISALSWLLPGTSIQLFAVFSGVCHALPGIGVYWLLVYGYQMRTPRAVLTAAAVSILFAFNGLAIAIARNPHFEMLIAGAGIMFLTALLRGRQTLAAVFFVICLATREDAGFHLFAILIVLAVVDRWYGIPWRKQKAVLAFAFVALSYSMLAIVLQRLAFPAGGHSLSGVYVGDPPFSTITMSVIKDRLIFYMLYRPYLVLPAYFALAWAGRSLNPYLLVGYAAFLPWGLLHLVAQSEIAGTLSNYYPFPFLIASFWPLAGAMIHSRRLGVTGVSLKPVAAFSVMILTSFVGLDRQHNPGRIDIPESFVLAPSLEQQHATDDALRILASSNTLGQVMVDAAVASLVPNSYQEDDIVSASSPRVPDSVIYFVAGYQAAIVDATARRARLERHYMVPGTSIRVATSMPIDGLAGLVSVLSESPIRLQGRAEP